MNDSPLVSIVILTSNQRNITLACLRSLQTINYSNLEIIVVDNGSSDGSAEAIQNEYPLVNLIKAASNFGCAKGRNLGADAALSRGADYVLFLDNDTQVDPFFLERLIQVAETDSSIGVLSSKIVRLIDPRMCWTAGGRISQGGLTISLYWDEPVSNVPDIEYEVDWVPGCVILVRRDLLEKIGGFDETYYFYFEDVAWCVNASRAGYHILVVPQSVVYHLGAQSLGGHKSIQRAFLKAYNRLRFISSYVQNQDKYLAILGGIRHELIEAEEDLEERRLGTAIARCRGILHFLILNIVPVIFQSESNSPNSLLS